jgi:hypothetical protein
MPDTLAHTPVTDPPMGLAARTFGVLMSPRATYANVAAYPRALGVLLLGVGIVTALNFAFMSTDVGQQALLDQQYRSIEQFADMFNTRIPDEAYRQMEESVGNARYWSAAATLIGTPLIVAAIAGLLIVIFNFVMGGEATYRQVYAITAHAGLIFALGGLFATPLNYATEFMATSRANLGLLVPFLPDTSFVARLLGFIDLFWVWWMVSLAIGMGVLYKRKTGPIATTFLVTYLVVAAIVAAVRGFGA